MVRIPLMAAALLLAAAPSMPHPAPAPAAAPARSYPAIERIDWSYGDESYPGGTSKQLRLKYDGMNSGFGPDEAPAIMGDLATASLSSPGEAVSFRLAREAGTLACTGRVGSGRSASGTCRFDPDERFAAGLASRGLAPDGSKEMLGLTLVDAHLAVLDGLLARGFRFGKADDLIAVSALHVTPEFAGELRDAGLQVDALDDLIAARALKLDAAWLREMADAGYPDLTLQQAIQMRALGITPDYAMRMARVMTAMGDIQ